MTRKRRLIWSILFPIACIFVWLIYSLIRNGFDLSNTSLPEYNELFTKETQLKLPVPLTFKSKVREPESNYILDSDFHLTVYKLILVGNKPLNKLVNLRNEYSGRSFDVVSNYAEDSYLQMTGTSSKIDPVSVINFKCHGGLIKTLISNDTLACYYLKFKNFSISYDNDSFNDIWGQAKDLGNDAISVAFIKKRQLLYVMLLFRTKEENRDFQADLLYSMIKK